MTTCCPTNIQPVQGLSYQCKGKMITLPCGVQAYVSGSEMGFRKAILATYDIFGFHATTKQTCDILSSDGYVVILPDFFKNDPWPMDPWPPADFGPLMEWVGKVGTYATLRPIFVEAVAYLKETEKIPCDQIGGVGFCWGAKPMFAAQAEGLLKAIASAHPSFIDVQDAQGATAPVCLLPTKDDPPMEDIQKVLSENKFSDKNVFVRFDEMHHGFMAARGNWENPSEGRNAKEALSVLQQFFRKAL